MANIVKYVSQTISVNSNNENLSTNGHYVGEHKGTPTQAYGETIGAYDVSYDTVRYGTMMGDAAVGSMPKQGVFIAEALTGCTSSNAARIVSKEDNLSVTYTAAEGYELPTAVTVKIGGETATVTTDYTWTKATGVLAIAKAKLTGDLEITVTATEDED